MSPQLAFRLTAAAFAALVIGVALLQARGPVVRPQPAAPPPTLTLVRPPVNARLARCQTLGLAGGQSPECLQAWADERARFLGAGAKAGR